MTDLAPQGCFIAADAVECVVGQISKTQEATCKINAMVDQGSTELRSRAEHLFRIGHALRCQIAIDIDGISAPVRGKGDWPTSLATPIAIRKDTFSGCRLNLAAPPHFSHVVGLYFGQVGLYGRGTVQPQQQTGTRHQR